MGQPSCNCHDNTSDGKNQSKMKRVKRRTTNEIVWTKKYRLKPTAK
jgi:hypothetical protein